MTVSRFALRALVVPVVLCSGACESPDISPPAPIDWMPDAAGLAPPVAVGEPQPLELATLLKLAGDRPLEIALARAHAATADAMEDLAESRWLPTLHPRLALVRHENRLQDTIGTFLDTDKQSVFAGGGLALGFNPAEAWFTSIAASQRAQAARLGVRTAQHVNVGVAVRLYYDLLQQSASLQIAEREVLHGDELVKVQEAGEKAGSTLLAEVLRAKAFRAAAAGRVAAVQAEVAKANARLVGLLLLPAGTELVPTETTVASIDFGEADQPLADLLARALVARPEVNRARALVQAADTDRSRESWSWLIPELRLGAEYGSFGQTLNSGHEREDFYADLFWTWSFGGVANARIADAKFRTAELRLRLLERDVRTELQVAVADIHATKARVVAARQEVAAAGAALVLVTARQEGGKLLLLERLDAERANTEASINLIRAITSQNRAQFELHRVLGGGKMK